jgi:hypothetical protein
MGWSRKGNFWMQKMILPLISTLLKEVSSIIKYLLKNLQKPSCYKLNLEDGFQSLLSQKQQINHKNKHSNCNDYSNKSIIIPEIHHKRHF